MSGKEVRTYQVSPEFMQQEPALVGRLLADIMAEHPDAFWMVLVASAEDTRVFMETHFWHFAPAEEIGA